MIQGSHSHENPGKILRLQRRFSRSVNGLESCDDQCDIQEIQENQYKADCINLDFGDSLNMNALIISFYTFSFLISSNM